MTTDLDLLTVGRISIDLYCDQPGAGWHEARSFHKAVGGSPTNVAVAAARLGHRAAVVSAVGDDGFGEYVRGKLLGSWKKGEISRDELIKMMSGGAELDALEHELGRPLDAPAPS